MYNSINVYIIRTFSEYEDPIKQTIFNWSKNINYYSTDHMCRTGTNYKPSSADLSIILISDPENERYGHPANWLKAILKNINLGVNILILIYGNEKDWEGYRDILNENVQIEFMQWMIDDNYNISTIKRILNNYIAIK